jgi:hypothetical protein
MRGELDPSAPTAATLWFLTCSILGASAHIRRKSNLLAMALGELARRGRHPSDSDRPSSHTHAELGLS